MNILLTGGGFLGTHIITSLSARGHFVVSLARKKPTDRGPADQCYPYSAAGAIEALGHHRIDAVVHTATSWGREQRNYRDILHTNVITPLEIAHACGTRIGRWISFGTALPRHLNPYALSKHHFSDWLRRPGTDEIAPRVEFKTQLIYGPRDHPEALISQLIRDRAAGTVLTFTHGEQKRDFLYVSDAVSAVIAVLESTYGADPYQEIELGTGSPLRVRDVIEKVHRACRSEAVLQFGVLPLREGEPEVITADTRTLLALGWRALVDIDEGILRIVNPETQRRKRKSENHGSGR